MAQSTHQSCQAWLVTILTLLLGRLSPLSGYLVLAGPLAGSFENKGFLYRLFLVKYKFFRRIFQQNKEQKMVNFLSALPDSMPLKPAIMANTAMNSPVYVLFSSHLDHWLSQIAVLSIADINNLHDSKL